MTTPSILSLALAAALLVAYAKHDPFAANCPTGKATKVHNVKVCVEMKVPASNRNT